MNRVATATIVGITPYSASRGHQIPRNDKETGDDHEKRTWRERLHVLGDGRVFIPPMAFKNCLAETAKFLGIQIKGKGKATYTKHFEAGTMVMDPLVLNVKKEDVPGEWVFVPSDGVRGSGKRVMKCFPTIPAGQWGGDVVFHVFDDTITDAVFEHHLTEAGKFVGVGRFRPRNNGFYGRFSVSKIVWQ